MANLQRVRAEWSGAPVIGPSVSTFYFDEAFTGVLPLVRSFFDSLKALIPTGVTITIPSSGDLIDIPSGGISGSWSETGVLNVVCSGAGVFAQGVGGRVIWDTSGLRGGRRVRGSTFLVPLTSGQMDTDGTIGAVPLATISGAATTLFTGASGNMRIYSRPHKGTTDGQENTVIGGRIPDHISWLRTRRT